MRLSKSIIKIEAIVELVLKFSILHVDNVSYLLNMGHNEILNTMIFFRPMLYLTNGISHEQNKVAFSLTKNNRIDTEWFVPFRCRQIIRSLNLID